MSDHLASRREWLRLTGSFAGLGSLGSLAAFCRRSHDRSAAPPQSTVASTRRADLHHRARARRVIFLFQSGGPSQMDLFDPKPKLREMHGQELPASVRGGQIITVMTRSQATLPVYGSAFEFERASRCDFEMSTLLPHTRSIAHEILLIRSMVTEAINHDPAAMHWLTGNQRPGRPSLGAWLSYGLGSDNPNLPEHIVLLSGKGGQPLQSSYWGAGFLPTRHQGTQFRSGGDPVLYANDPPGIDRASRLRLGEALKELNQEHFRQYGDPETAARIHAYEQALQMQTAVPGLMNLAAEPQHILDMYGVEPGKPSYAANCLLARRLVEQGVRYVQLCHRDWDHHVKLQPDLPKVCESTDKASAALVADLKQRGLLDDTIVVWGGEFGRTAYCQGMLTPELAGRDHHPRCFSVWVAGGGFKAGRVHGATDDFGYNIVSDPVDVHDLHATILHLLGIDHTRLTYRHQGRYFRLTDVAGRVVQDLIA